jgi:hypothetical protein
MKDESGEGFTTKAQRKAGRDSPQRHKGHKERANARKLKWKLRLTNTKINLRLLEFILLFSLCPLCLCGESSSSILPDSSDLCAFVSLW